MELVVLKEVTDIEIRNGKEVVAIFHDEDLYELFVFTFKDRFSFWVENEARYEDIHTLIANNYV